MTLLETFEQHTGPVIHRYPHHLEVYERYLARYRHQPVTLLEIGLGTGGSLALWKTYLGPQAKIIGVDIEDRSDIVQWCDVEVLQADQGSPKFWAWFTTQYPHVDVVIDDGSHRCGDQRVTFDALFPILDEQGIYACEDLHTSYHPDYGGGYRSETSFIEYLKTRIDALNATASVSPDLRPSAFTESAFGLHFYPGLCVLEKRPARTYGSALMRGRRDG